MTLNHGWTLGAVLEEHPVDELTQLLVVRPDAPESACRDLERRLLGHRLAGRTTVLVDLAGAERLSGAMIASLRRSQLKLGSRNGRLVVSAERPELARALEAAGLEVAVPLERM
jgi:anti-anti-sigma regulatory factor